MRSREENSLDLNNLPPQDHYYTRSDVTDTDTSSSPGGYRKKKSGGGRSEKEEAGKVYECRFCSLKFCKSQALGGHMNRHRQERETETLNKARQLVFSNDLAPPPHIGYVSSGQAVPHGGYHQASNMNTDDTLRSIYNPTTSRMFSTAPLIPPPPPTMMSYPSAAPPPNNYYVGNVVTNSCYGGAPPAGGSYYTCIGAPVSHGAANNGGDQVEGRNWGRR